MVVILAVLALSPQHRHHGQMHMRTKMKPVNEEPAIRAQGKKVERAFETKNVALFRSVMASNFQQETPDHKVANLKQVLKGFRDGLAGLTDIDATVNVQWVKVNGRTATVEDRYWLKAKMRDKKGMHNVRMEGSETVSLKKMGGTWLAYYDKVHDESFSVDGHVVSHMP